MLHEIAGLSVSFWLLLIVSREIYLSNNGRIIANAASGTNPFGTHASDRSMANEREQTNFDNFTAHRARTNTRVRVCTHTEESTGDARKLKPSHETRSKCEYNYNCTVQSGEKQEKKDEEKWIYVCVRSQQRPDQAKPNNMMSK